MNNYFPKNIKTILSTSDTILLESDTNNIETVVLGGYVSNISNIDRPIDPGVVDYFTLKLVNTQTQEITILFKDIPIKANSVFPFGKIYLNDYNQLVASSTYSNNLQLTLSYFYIVSYENGIVKIDFTPSDVLSFHPTWNLINQDINYNNFEYVSVLQGEQTIQFDTILGWEAPPSININVQKLKTTKITVNYILLNSTVSFFTKQLDLVNQFKWRLVGETIWLNNNDIMTIPQGIHEFEFAEIDLFEKHNNIILTTLNKNFYSNEIIFNRIKTLITVNLSPSNIKFGSFYHVNNHWRVVFPSGSLSPWYNSGESILFNIADDYVLEILENDYIIPEQNFIAFNLEKENPLVFNINMFAKLVTVDDNVLEDVVDKLIVTPGE